ncbi:MAG: MFS transporter [Candidatus Krumholzibacteriia bacterium]
MTHPPDRDEHLPRPDEPPRSAGGVDAFATVGLEGSWLRSTFASLRLRNFRLFYIGQGTSLVGTWVRRTALGWLVYELTGSRALLGAVMGLSLLPLFVLSPAAGAIADRVDRRRMIIAAQVLASLTSAAIAALVLSGQVQTWHLMALATLGGVAFAVEAPARQAFVVEMVGREHLLNAIALNSALVNLSRIIGPGVAGLLMGTIGIGFCFLVDAVSYLAVIATLVAMRLQPRTILPRRTSHWQELLEGFREVRRNRPVRILLLLLFVMGVFGWSFQTLMPAIAQDLLHLSELQYGVLMSMFGVGAIVGALIVAARTTSGTSRLQVFGGLWTLCAGSLIVSMSRAMLPMSAGIMVAGFGAVMFLSTSNTLVQTSVDDGIRGRVMGIWAVGFGGSLPLGSFLAGWVAELISPYLTIALFATVLAAASFIIWARLPHRE